MSRLSSLAYAATYQQFGPKRWYTTIEDLAAGEKINASYVSRLLRLASLAPTAVQTIMDGKHPA